MFLTTSFNHVYAIDATTGEEYWHYKHKMGPITTFCCGPNNRGVAVEGDRLFMGTLDAKLVALDAKTGKLLWETQIADPEKGYSETMAPAVVDGKVLIGTNGGEYGVRGFVKAFNAADGKLLWTFYSIPDKGQEGVWAENDATGRNMKRDIAAEKKMLQEKGGEFYQTLGGGVWMTPAIDLKTRTGVLRRRQPVARTCTAPSGRATTCTPTRWSRRPRQGHVQVALAVHRARRVGPRRGEPGDPHAGQGRVRQDGRRRDARRQDGPHLRARAQHGQAHPLLEAMIPQENMWVLPTKEGARMLPGANGGVEWSPMAFNPKTRLAYAANLHQPMTYHVEESPYPGGKLWLGGAFKTIPSEQQWGRLVAVNVDTGKVAWGVKTDQPLIGGVLATAGNLVFNGEATAGSRRSTLPAARSSVRLQRRRGRECACLSSYMVNGKQYVRRRGGRATTRSTPSEATACS
jgi:glucose dehydrogenase